MTTPASAPRDDQAPEPEVQPRLSEGLPDRRRVASRSRARLKYAALHDSALRREG